MTDEVGHSEQRAKLSPTAATRRTLTMAVLLIVASGFVVGHLQLGAVTGQPIVLHWWWIAAIAIAAELAEFHVEFRREMYSFTFSEIALVLGLFLASPRDLIIGRLVGEALFLAIKQRQAIRKFVLNLAAFLAEVTTLLAVHQWVFDRQIDIRQPTSWLVALVSVALADLVGYVIVFQAVRWHGAPITLASILGIGALTVPVNTSFALIAGVLVVDEPWATILLTGIGAFLLVAYRSYTALSQRFESLSTLYDFTRLVSGTKRPDSVLEAILTQAKDLLRAERAEIWLTDVNEFRMRLGVHDSGRTTGALGDVYSDAIHAWLGTVDGAAVINDASPRIVDRDLALALRARNAIVAPITESGEVVGLVAVVNRLGELVTFQDTDRTMFATLANHASVALENGRLVERLHQEASERRHESLHDALTGLPNRVLLGTRIDDELNAVSRSGGCLAVGVMDLDRFKEINDTLGHQSGDAVLVEVAQRIRDAAGPHATVARLGGDEFALLVPLVGSRHELEALARGVRAEVAKPIHTDGLRINVNVSIGFALAPDDADDGATLLQRADVAMYSAKAGTGNGVAFYDAFNDENSPRRFALGNDLLGAITDGQLAIVFQPKARLVDGVVVGAEALVRWRHPTMGLIMPDEFIPLAERAGGIDELTKFVLRASLQEAARWQALGHAWSVSVNVAMRNLLDDNFVAVVSRLLDESSIDPSVLTLEVTETGIMSDATRTIDVLQRLAALGVTLSIDDFGTGYSSLSHLQQLPVSEIKIDKMFVLRMATDPNADTIVRAVLDLARNLDLTTVAEGVEDHATWEMLRSHGCATAQGFHIARPMPSPDLPTWHRRWTTPAPREALTLA